MTWLLALGTRTVPVVATDHGHVAGANLSAVAGLLGLRYDDSPTLSPDELVTRLALVLEAAVRLTSQIPEQRLGDNLPGRDRSYLALANHIVQIAHGFVEVSAGARLSSVRAAAVPETEREPGILAERADDTRTSIANWWAGTDDRACDRRVGTYAGTLSLHQVLERTTWHCAQHVRQLAMVLEILGIPPDRPLTTTDLDGLPVPEDVWDS